MYTKCDLHRIKGLRSNSLQNHGRSIPKKRKHNLHSVPCNLVHDRCYFPLCLIMLVVMNSIAPFWSSSSLLHFSSLFLLLVLLLCLSSPPSFSLLLCLFILLFSFSLCLFLLFLCFLFLSSTYLMFLSCLSCVLCVSSFSFSSSSSFCVIHHSEVLLHFSSFLVFLFLLISVVLSFPLLP